MLQSAAVAAATAFLVLAFCTGIKAACRKKLRQDENDKAIHDGYMGAKDGFDETEHSAFVSMQDEAEKIEACIKENLNGEIRDDRAVRAGNVSTCVFHQVASLPSGLPYITMP